MMKGELDLPRDVELSDARIRRAARLWFERHGTQAVAEARRRAAALRRTGDIAGADGWLRVLVALDEMNLGRGD